MELRSNMKSLLRIFVVLVACGFAVGGWFFWAEVREPSFKQRSLSDWLVSYQQANRYFPRSHESDEAIRHIGTEAVPYLLKWLQYEDSVWLSRCKATLNKAPLGLRGAATNVSGWISDWQVLRDKRYGGAVWGFGILGADARPAVPSLAALAVDRRPRIASRAVRVLQDLGTNAAPAVPLLLKSLESQDIFVASSAASALGCLQLDPDSVVPALTEHIWRPNGEINPSVAWGLSRFGTGPSPFLAGGRKEPGTPLRNYDTNNMTARVSSRSQLP